MIDVILPSECALYSDSLDEIDSVLSYSNDLTFSFCYDPKVSLHKVEVHPGAPFIEVLDLLLSFLQR